MTIIALLTSALLVGGPTPAAAAPTTDDPDHDRAGSAMTITAIKRGWSYTTGDQASQLSFKQMPSNWLSLIDTRSSGVVAMPDRCHRHRAYTGPGIEVWCKIPSGIYFQRPMHVHVNTAGGDDRVLTYRGDGVMNAAYQFTVSAGAGDDTVLASQGFDILRGGPGRDTIDGGHGYDKVHGDGGNDHLFGHVGDDWLWGGGGHDVLRGGVWKDVLRGGPGRDRMFGEAGYDWLYAVPGRDDVNGGSEPDKASVSAHDTRVSLEKTYRRDSDVPKPKPWVPWTGGDRSLTVTRLDARDPAGVRRHGYLIDAGAQDSRQSAWVNDRGRLVVADRGSKELKGTMPRGCARVRSITRYIQITCRIPDGATYRRPLTIKSFPRTGDDVVDFSRVPARVALWVDADRGHDTATGGPGRDFFNMAQDNDVANGGPGRDWVRGNDGADVVRGGPGHDDVLGVAGNDRLWGGTGSDVMHGGPGVDHVHGDDDRTSDKLMCGQGTRDSAYVVPRTTDEVWKPGTFEACERTVVVR